MMNNVTKENFKNFIKELSCALKLNVILQMNYYLEVIILSCNEIKT